MMDRKISIEGAGWGCRQDRVKFDSRHVMSF